MFAPCALRRRDQRPNCAQFESGDRCRWSKQSAARNLDGDELAARNILYTPDYAANSGGVINGCRDLLGWDSAQSAAKVDGIYDTVLNIFEITAAEGIPTYKAADRLAEARFQS